MDNNHTVTSVKYEIDSPYRLEDAARQRFADEGFIRIDGVLSPETIEHYEPEITAKVLELNTMHLPMEERSTYKKAFLQVSNLWQHSELARELTFSQRLARIAAELMGVERVRLYHDQALYKETGGGITPWHADQYYWPLSSDRTCTVWIPLQDTPLEMGPLSFAVGSNNFEFGRDMGISDESEKQMQKAFAEKGFMVSEEPYRLGDVSFHQGWTFHRAGPNRTQAPRRVMTIIYIDADITLTKPTNSNQELERWFPGIEPGEVPDTPLTPVLYEAAGDKT
ncbi:phytanoyl-CoA dioxygenase family protein [Pseudarthrobacter sp. SSS035]|uniref:phytanoyl-CoA dioxygenase family protein n=1 Tax=Pseudarthrobacter sp. SSS035 TaxID=2931399 RepID=UPI00200FBDA3|nr:phytanoyl-CoA dioxygenase family protein [Pseudarthrobacter sp. SSS035]